MGEERGRDERRETREEGGREEMREEIREGTARERKDGAEGSARELELGQWSEEKSNIYYEMRVRSGQVDLKFLNPT